MIVPIADIRTDGGTQPRIMMDPLLVSEYAEAMDAGDVFPPLEVTFDGAHHWLTDGFHRHAAYLKRKVQLVECNVTRGTHQEAVWRSLAANAKHGKRRTRADLKRAIEQVLRNDDWRALSDNAIAAHLGCTDKTVTSHRRRMEATSEIPKSDTRVGTDGRTINTKNIGAKPEPASEAPKVEQRPKPESKPLASPTFEQSFPPAKVAPPTSDPNDTIAEWASRNKKLQEQVDRLERQLHQLMEDKRQLMDAPFLKIEDGSQRHGLLKAVGFNSSTTVEELKRAHHQLTDLIHPDKEQDPARRDALEQLQTVVNGLFGYLKGAV